MTRAERMPVFVGPSLPRAQRQDGPFEWLAPAAAGDLLALLDRRPPRVCLIDGLFDTCPAPWHKEALLLMSHGTTLFGAASMGALRAAELHPFGMIGVGTIFEAYRDGRLHGDDEVALLHATGQLDWAPLTVPMIEVRATLVAACRARLIDVTDARRIRARIRDIFFGERDWPMIGRVCTAEGLLSANQSQRLEHLHVRLKQRDALACLEAARSWSAQPRPCPAPPDTAFLRRLASEVQARPIHRV